MPSRKVGLAQRLHDQVKSALLSDDGFNAAVSSGDVEATGAKAVSLILVRARRPLLVHGSASQWTNERCSAAHRSFHELDQACGEPALL